MRVNINQLQEGCIISDDVFSLTNKPIVPKKTVIAMKHINALQSFLIKDVHVEPILINGEPFKPTEVIDDGSSQGIDSIENGSFLQRYIKAVKEYKQQFQSWQAGSPVEVSKVRPIILPLLEEVLESPSELFSLYHYSTREDYLYHHSVSVGLLSGFIGSKLQYDQADCNQLAIAGLLSDCGMAKIDSRILKKSASLSFHEYNEVKKHPLYSYKMIEKISLLKESVKLAVLQHHERLDGTGYFLGVTSEKLHPFGKIIAVADVYHAMTSERPYSNKQSPFMVLESIKHDSFGKFDHKVVQALSSGVSNLSIGTRVRLSNGKVGEIVFIDENSPTRPIIKVTDEEFVHLNKRRELYIEEIL